MNEPVQPAASEKTPNINVQMMIRGRRPHLSASGGKPKAPNVMPKVPAPKISPNWAESNENCWATDGATNAIAWASKPSNS